MVTSTLEVTMPKPTTAARLDWVDAAKGMSILLVVAHHVVWYLQRSGHAPAAVVMGNEALASLRMPLFFPALVPPAVDPDDSANVVDFAWSLLLPGPSMWFLYALAVFAVLAKLMRP